MQPPSWAWIRAQSTPTREWCEITVQGSGRVRPACSGKCAAGGTAVVAADRRAPDGPGVQALIEVRATARRGGSDGAQEIQAPF